MGSGAKGTYSTSTLTSSNEWLGRERKGYQAPLALASDNFRFEFSVLNGLGPP